MPRETNPFCNTGTVGIARSPCEPRCSLRRQPRAPPQARTRNAERAASDSSRGVALLAAGRRSGYGQRLTGSRPNQFARAMLVAANGRVSAIVASSKDRGHRQWRCPLWNRGRKQTQRNYPCVARSVTTRTTSSATCRNPPSTWKLCRRSVGAQAQRSSPEQRHHRRVAGQDAHLAVECRRDDATPPRPRTAPLPAR